MQDHVYVESARQNRCLFCGGAPEVHMLEIEVGPCNMTEAEIQDAIHMTETGTDPATAVMLAKQHP